MLPIAQQGFEKWPDMLLNGAQQPLEAWKVVQQHIEHEITMEHIMR